MMKKLPVLRSLFLFVLFTLPGISSFAQNGWISTHIAADGQPSDRFIEIHRSLLTCQVSNTQIVIVDQNGTRFGPYDIIGNDLDTMWIVGLDPSSSPRTLTAHGEFQETCANNDLLNTRVGTVSLSGLKAPTLTVVDSIISMWGVSYNIPVLRVHDNTDYLLDPYSTTFICTIRQDNYFSGPIIFHGPFPYQHELIDTTFRTTGHYYYQLDYNANLGGQVYYAPPAYADILHTNDLVTASSNVAGSTQLSWPDFSRFYADNGLVITRDGVQLNVLSRFTNTYSDGNGIPGRQYSYGVSRIDAAGNTAAPILATGYSQPDGRLSGNVRASNNAPIDSAWIFLSAKVVNRGHVLHDTTVIQDSAMTDVTGAYEFDNLFYDSIATFTLVPHRGTNKFNPDTITHSLKVYNTSGSSIDFTDTSVFNITGQVTFSADPHCPAGGCHPMGVKFQDQNGGIYAGQTDMNGVFNLSVPYPGNYTFIPFDTGHTFSPISRTLYISDNTTGVNFTDLTRDTMFISLSGECGNAIMHHTTYAITSIGNNSEFSFNDTIYRDSVQALTAPAQKYNVMMSNGYRDASWLTPDINLPGLLDSSNLTVNLHDTFSTWKRISLTDSVLTKNNRFANFVARGTITVTLDTGSFERWRRYDLCPTPLNGGFISHQGTPNYINISIRDVYNYPINSTSCPVDSGTLSITDQVGDRGTLPDTLFRNGQLVYAMIPGSPEITPPYIKNFQVTANVGNAHGHASQDVLVLGTRARTQTFVTVSPPLPTYILHAPPGSGSYSFLAQDSSITTTGHLSRTTSESGGLYVDMKLGEGIDVPFEGTSGAGYHVAAEVIGGGTQDHQHDFTTALTFHNQVATSNATSPPLSGTQGDVYVGTGYNMVFAPADQVSIDTADCSVLTDGTVVMNPSVNTVYTYTEEHIVNTLIPDLESLITTLQATAAYNRLHSIRDDSVTSKLYQSIAADTIWRRMVKYNAANIIKSFNTHNVSFSAGPGIDYSQVASHDTSSAYEYTQFINVDLQTNLFAKFGEFNEAEAGAKFTFRYEFTYDTAVTNNSSTTNGYHLQDNVVGNFYSMDVGTDPIFRTVSFSNLRGASACPHWPGTQSRDSVELLWAPGTSDDVSDVPRGATANYWVQVNNHSESSETRAYTIELDGASNPAGAIVTLGGQPITGSSASFSVPTSGLTLLMTVAPGPVASDYVHLKLFAHSGCDDGGGTAPLDFSAHFRSTCSDVTLYPPADGWRVNLASNDSLGFSYGGYDLNNDSLKYIELQYLGPSGLWTDILDTRINKVDLSADATTGIWSVANHSIYPDGQYQIRAVAHCNNQLGGEKTSDPASGQIDRSPLALFGTPSPADGILNVSDNISVTFNNPILCDDAITATLTRNDNGLIVADSVICNGTSLIIQTNPDTLLNSLENVTLTATVSNVVDLSGTTLQQPISWSFVVSRSKLFWSPANANLTTVLSSAGSITATMYNVGALDSFTFTKIPSWLSLSQAGPYIVNQGTPTSHSELPLTFTSSASLNQGHYTDTIIAMTSSGRSLNFFVTLDVVTPAPSWSVNPSAFQHNMTITANYSVTDSNAPLSSDRRDIIAVFVGNECRGLGAIRYDAASNKYAAFITAYSNTQMGDTFTFRIWSALEGIEYAAKEKLPFFADANVGQIAAPYILHGAGHYQTIPLAAGWNWISLNVANTDMSPANIMRNVTLNDSVQVKGLSSYALYTATSGWTGTLSALDLAHSYMIKINHPDTIHLLGQTYTGGDILSIARGWNWVGYQRHKIDSAASYLSNIVPLDSDLLKSETQFTQYFGGSWAGSLQNMYPGQGYRLKSVTAIDIVLPADRSLPSWTVDESRYEQNMTVTADLQFNGVSTTQSHYIVGAFVNGECIGTTQPQFIPALGFYRVFMTIHGDPANASQAITYKVYDTDNDVEYVPTFDPQSLEPDATAGSLTTPYVINVEISTGIHALNYLAGYNLQQNVPNPFAQNTSITYTIPAAENVTLTIYDESGRKITELVNAKQDPGTHTVSFTQEGLQPGVYLYQLKSGEFVKTRRMLILK